MLSPTEWRERVSELRQMAQLAEDAERQRKLSELADRWEKVADALEGDRRG